MPRYSSMPDRDDRGRFVSDDDHRGRGSYGGSSYGGDRSGRERDERGRFMSDDDRGGRGSSRYDDDDRRYSSSSRGGDYGRDHGQGGWFGDSEGHAEAARRGWDHRRDDDRGRSSASGRYDDDRRSSGRYDDDRHYARGYDDDRGRSSSSGRYDDDRRYSSSSRGGDYGRDHGQGGWFGDSEGHAEAARRGWEHRRDDDRGSYGRGRR